jgi:hypothetical protein
MVARKPVQEINVSLRPAPYLSWCAVYEDLARIVAMVQPLREENAELRRQLAELHARPVPRDGRDLDLAQALALIREEVKAEVGRIEKPKDGRDGVGFDNLDVVQDPDDPRDVRLQFTQGDRTRIFRLTMPAILDRGVWRPGGWLGPDGVQRTYLAGDACSFGGSLWVLQRGDGSQRPGTIDSGWRLSVKSGRPGKDHESQRPTDKPVRVTAAATKPELLRAPATPLNPVEQARRASALAALVERADTP